MNTRVDVEDLQLTRTEKLLALVLTAFLLLGGIWTYTRVDDVVRSHVKLPTATLAQDPAIARESTARERLFRAEDRSRSGLRELELRREAYRTALEAHKPARLLERRYNAAQASYNAAQRDVRAARRELFAAAPAANAAQRRGQQKVDAVLHRQERDSVLIRLGLGPL